MTDETLKTPADWCLVEGVEIMYRGGWADKDGPDWTEPITHAEFKRRLKQCTFAEFTPKPDAPTGCPRDRSAGMSAWTDRPLVKPKWRKPIFIATSSSVRGWRITLMRNPWGSVIGLGALYGNRQACLKWKTWGTP